MKIFPIKVVTYMCSIPVDLVDLIPHEVINMIKRIATIPALGSNRKGGGRGANRQMLACDIRSH